MQNELMSLERTLDLMDEEYSRKEMPDDTNNGSYTYEPFIDRKNLITEILPKKLATYSTLKYIADKVSRLILLDKLIHSNAQLAARPTVNHLDAEKVQSWFHDISPRAIEETEQEYIKYHEDLIHIQPKVNSWFRSVLGSTFLLDMPTLRPYFERYPQDKRVQDGNTRWQNDERVERFSSAVIGCVGLAILIGPLWLLEYITPDPIRLGITTAFIFLFFVLIVVATTAQVSEGLAATAAYSAVLMVFL